MAKLWPWNQFERLRQERDEAHQIVDFLKQAGQTNRNLLREAYFRDPETGRLMPKGKIPLAAIKAAQVRA